MNLIVKRYWILLLDLAVQKLLAETWVQIWSAACTRAVVPPPPPPRTHMVIWAHGAVSVTTVK